MQYSQIASILLLAGSAVAIPTPQDTATAAAAAPAPVADKSGAFVDAGLIGVGLSKLDNTEGLTFLMDEHKLSSGQAANFVIFEPTIYEKIEIAVGDGFQPATIRCKILDLHGMEIFGLRGTNRDTTFSDANKGFWTLEHPSQVGEIICDPDFKADNRPAV